MSAGPIERKLVIHTGLRLIRLGRKQGLGFGSIGRSRSDTYIMQLNFFMQPDLECVSSLYNEISNSISLYNSELLI